MISKVKERKWMQSERKQVRQTREVNAKWTQASETDNAIVNQPTNHHHTHLNSWSFIHSSLVNKCKEHDCFNRTITAKPLDDIFISLSSCQVQTQTNLSKNAIAAVDCYFSHCLISWPQSHWMSVNVNQWQVNTTITLSFVVVWNSDRRVKIQKNRPHLKSGKSLLPLLALMNGVPYYIWTLDKYCSAY